MQESQQFFYLGRDDDGTEILYKSKDLTTHALIIGMTGSGKTGLGVGLIEEATIDNIPSIIIDPKGDMGNLLLAFPTLSKEEFKPWIDADEAGNRNQSVDEAADETARVWNDGLIAWDEDKGRVEMFKKAARFTIYTPAASHGVGVNILSSFKTPPKEVLEDTDTLNMIISSSAANILSLVGINADPLSSKEHILLSTIFLHYYKNGKNVSLEELMSALVTPPFEKIGIFSLETFFSKDKRMDLAMKLNAIIASPSFASWLEGESMDIDAFLFDKEKKPKVSIFNISHLNDSERMFFVTLLLNNLVAWTRAQEGSSSLKALLYMDEVFGYFPPNANPPSKLPMLTLLKQARAFGLGVVLSTQNPVDLDYRGLSNIGTWFIGRLQTSQDKERVIEGLVGIKGSDLNKQELFATISNLKKRYFLLKNINEEGLNIFQTRWTLSYLKGPLSKEQIKTLTKASILPNNKSKGEVSDDIEININVKFISRLKQYYLYESKSENYRLSPYLVCAAEARFVSVKKDIYKEQNVYAQATLKRNSFVKWSMNGDIDESLFEDEPRVGSRLDGIVSFVDDNKRLSELQQEALEFIGREAKLTILSVPALKLDANFDESEAAFRARVEDRLDEAYGQRYEQLKALYDKKHKVIEDKFSRLSLQLEKEKADVQAKTIDTVVSFGGGILGALFGGRKSGNITKAASGVKNANKVLKEHGDVKLVEHEIAEVQEEAKRVENEFQAKNKALKDDFNMSRIVYEETVITPRKADIYNDKMFILWREA
jgi:hypothetical protein